MASAAKVRRQRILRFDRQRFWSAMTVIVSRVYQCVGVVSLCVGVTLGLIGSFILVLSQGSSAPRVMAAPSESLVEPRRVAAYLDGYARADVLAIDDVASPLNRWEWNRRGIGIAARQRLFPESRGSDPSAVWIHFDYVGGIQDGDGFSHLLYTARPTTVAAPTFPSVWRVDADPSGRVIWAEMVFLFAGATTTLVTVPSTDSEFQRSLPKEILALRPRLLAGVRVPDGPQAYYLLGLPGSSLGSVRPKPEDPIFFIGVDEEGLVRPGAWSFGQSDPEPSHYGQAPARRPMITDANLAELLARYNAAP